MKKNSKRYKKLQESFKDKKAESLEKAIDLVKNSSTAKFKASLYL